MNEDPIAPPTGGHPVGPALPPDTLTIGRYVSLGWPVPAEFDAITALRNADRVRQWFLDDTPLDPIANRRWLSAVRERKGESLLSIRFHPSGELLGMVGWTDHDPVARSAWFGRFALDLDVARRLAIGLPEDYPGFAIDIGRTVRDYVFEELNLEVGRGYAFVANQLARRANRIVGWREVGRVMRTRLDGSTVETVDVEMTRVDWEAQLRQERQVEEPQKRAG